MPTIEDIEVFSFTLPFRGLFKTSKGTVGSAATGRPIVLTKLTTSDGSVGWGEGSPSHTWSPETRESVVSVLKDHFIPAVNRHPAGRLRRAARGDEWRDRPALGPEHWRCARPRGPAGPAGP